MLIENLPKNIFWDIDFSRFDEIKNKRLIIERVFTMGDLADIHKTVQFYGIEIIKKEIVKAGFLDHKTLNWVSKLLSIPKTQFKCFIKIQSNQVHWNF
ncbi:MAG: hypothetical protein COX70_09950 [Flavobacteriales bacterium CG_4_10_14_0_2_um_filter_32_8]|nr:MAG: hypothetical protein COX70_09950 [Flavobacteriales bacterium CG_4_10_14_0_2_um_filter_32_8]PJB13901.1 MAG: hypothetical protein CO118_11345 [Flavobacteriales bacterium CG_4_9_14_3_um_filter_32_8]